MKHPGAKIIFAAATLLSASSIYAQDKKDAGETVIIGTADTLIIGRNSSGRKGNIVIRKWEGPHKNSFNFDTGRLKTFRFGKRSPGITILKLDGDSSFFNLPADTIIRGFHKKPGSSGDRMAILPPGDFNVQIPNAFKGFRSERFDYPVDVFAERPNSQHFSYTYTDKDGISNRSYVYISDASPNEMEHITGKSFSLVEELKISDFILFPNFSGGKTTISFSTTRKGTIKILNSDDEVLLANQFSAGNYFEQIPMLRNGIYFIYIQSGKAAYVRKVIKG